MREKTLRYMLEFFKQTYTKKASKSDHLSPHVHWQVPADDGVPRCLRPILQNYQHSKPLFHIIFSP